MSLSDWSLMRLSSLGGPSRFWRLLVPVCQHVLETHQKASRVMLLMRVVKSLPLHPIDQSRDNRSLLFPIFFSRFPLCMAPLRLRSAFFGSFQSACICCRWFHKIRFWSEDSFFSRCFSPRAAACRSHSPSPACSKRFASHQGPLAGRWQFFLNPPTPPHTTRPPQTLLPSTGIDYSFPIS